MFRFNGKVALVTGAGQSVGRGIAEVLAQRGARVVINDLLEGHAQEVAAKINSSGGVAMAMAFDVTDEQAVQKSIVNIKQQWKSVDILVNNAGCAGAKAMGQQSFRDMDSETINNYFQVNLFGVMHCSKAVLDDMCEQTWGRIINISSEAGRQGMNIGVSAYGSAKAGATHLNRHIAVEVAREGVTVNNISLGLMNNVPEEFTDLVVSSIPVGRLGTPEDVGYAVAYLASEEAAWLTGQTLPLNGGSVCI